MNDLQYFSKLKKELLRIFCEAHPHWSGGLEDFGVREIALFQNMLQEKTGGRVSQKWFYTHLKKDHDKLPRIDVLDLLAQFVGHENWGAFKLAVGSNQLTAGTHIKAVLLTIVGVSIFVLSILIWSNVSGRKTYEVCFMDAVTHKPLVGEKIKVKQLMKNESPKKITSLENNCHVFELEDEEITFIVDAAYFRTDTITRILRKDKQREVIPIFRDDYAWMVHVFSTSKIKDWKKRRHQLEQMIADDAMIFQVNKNNGRAMELFNKGDFITKLTLPVNSLRELEIIQTKYDDNGKISMIRFFQNQQ